MRRFIGFGLVFGLAACGDSPAEPASLAIGPSFDLHASSTAGDLDDANDAFNEVASNTYARHTAGTFDGDRFYMRTVATDFNGKDFTAELVFTLSNLGSDGATISYFGMGSGTGDPSYFNEASGVLFRIHAPDINGVHVAARNAGGPFTYLNTLTTNYGPSGSTHRAIITKAGSVMTLGFDKYNDGVVEASQAIDLSLYPGLVLDNTNSRIFFGTSTQDQFTLSIDVDSGDPVTVNDCKKGGWVGYGFRNQGQCIRFVNTGQDSR